MGPEEIDFAAFSGLTGKNHADNEHHVIARNAFRSRLPQSEGCQKRFDMWTAKAGLLEPGIKLRRLLGQMRTSAENGTLDIQHFTVLTNAISRVQAEFRATFLKLNGKALKREALRYVTKELKLPWVWLAGDLIIAWTHNLYGQIYGTEIEVRAYYQKIEPPAPKIEHILKPLDGEPLDEAAKRMMKEAEGFVERLKQHEQENQLPRGKRRSNTEVERNTEWFFRHRVNRESINEIAKHTLKGKNDPWPPDRKTVREGIKRAEGWLNAALPRTDGGMGE